MKQNDSKLRSTRSEENLIHPINTHQPVSPLGTIGSYLNCETQSLDAELIDSYRSLVTSEDADIWSTSDEVTGDDQQLQSQPTPQGHSVSRRNGLVGYRSHAAIISTNHLDSQSIRSNESHLSQQEIMPSDIRKRLSEVQSTGPISFEVSRCWLFCFLTASALSFSVTQTIHLRQRWKSHGTRKNNVFGKHHPMGICGIGVW